MTVKDENRYWFDKGNYQDKLEKIKTLVPKKGLTGNLALDLFIALQNFYYDYYNNGCCNWENRLPDLIDAVSSLNENDKFSSTVKEISTSWVSILNFSQKTFQEWEELLEVSISEELRHDDFLEELGKRLEVFMDFTIILNYEAHYNFEVTIKKEIGLV